MPSPESKQNFALLRDRILSEEGKEYWRSLEEYADTAEFKEFVSREYPHEIEEWDNSLSRRNFVKVMGASMALAGLSGCVIQPPEKIVPYVKQPDNILPGKPNFYATAMTIAGQANGVIVKSFDGRPIKIEGNPDHPASLGATNTLAQAAILGLYDPDRSQNIAFRGNSATWAAFMTAYRTAVENNRADGGAGIRFLSETVTSPTQIDQFNKIKAELPNAKLVQYEPINRDNAMAGAKLAFGSPVETIYKFENAERILTLDADILGGNNVAYLKGFSAGRKVEAGEMNRLYAIETGVSMTGAKADHRLAVKPSQMAEVVKAIAKALGVAGASSSYTENAAWIAAMAKDLAAHKGKSVVVPGEGQSAAVHAAAHAINAALGNVGQTVLYTEPFSPDSDKLQRDQLRELIADIDAGKVKMLVILGGNPVYNTPVDLRLTAERIAKITAAGLTVHVGLYRDETGENCTWHINEKHFLEQWGDSRAFDGSASMVQPLCEPLYGGKSATEVIQLTLKENFDKKDYDILKDYWQKTGITPAAAKPEAKAAAAAVAAPSNSEAKHGDPADHAAKIAPAENVAPKAPATADHKEDSTKPVAAETRSAAAPVAAPATSGTKTFEDNFRRAIHDGVVPNTTPAAKAVSANTAFLTQPEQKISGSGAIEFSIIPDPCVYDGRFCNNGWLQELPNPLNKVTWENVALVSPKTAEKLGLNTGNKAEEMTGGEPGASFITTRGGNQYSDLCKVTYQGAEMEKPVPMWITPGQPDDVVTLFMGYGRTRAGKVGSGLGYNVFDVRRSDAGDFGFGELKKTNETTTVASTQIHFNMEGRDLLRVFDLEQFEENPTMGHQHDEYPKSMYPYEEFQEVYNKNTRWGMSIDLNSCVGCNACVVACQAENNIPVVGKEQVERSREMHWLRIDAYYGGQDPAQPEGPYFQPVLCQQCEQAPCEVVCPVHATVHSAEGLNDMVYNRCVGTRYCSNNCPYKVRRFNFFLYQDWDTPQYKLMRNPEVSIRSRGVMEKCTYCTQRISAARIEAQKDGGRAIRDGEVVTACQASCPTDAITFGDLNDPNSEVSKAKKDHRNYMLLNELNTQPRTTYLAALKNQNKEMPDYKAPKPLKDAPVAKSEGGEAH